MRADDRPADSSVAGRIAASNPWYVGSHFEWADRPSVRRIYRRRNQYIRACIARARARLGQRLRLLDAGCGDGYWLSRLSDLPDVDLEGVDYNPLRVERARRIVPRATVHQTSLQDFTPPDRYDVVLLSQVIEHVEDDVDLLRRLRGLLKPGGVLVLGTTNEGALLQRLAVRRVREQKLTDHVHFYTEAELRAKILASGFRIDSVLREVFFFFTYAWFYRLAASRPGFRFLELLTWLFPSQCSDYYLECVAEGDAPA